jgi:hypothetical protein
MKNEEGYKLLQEDGNYNIGDIAVSYMTVATNPNWLTTVMKATPEDFILLQVSDFEDVAAKKVRGMSMTFPKNLSGEAVYKPQLYIVENGKLKEHLK